MKEAKKKENRTEICNIIRNKFRMNQNLSVRDISTNENLLRKGRKEFKIFKKNETKNIKIIKI